MALKLFMRRSAPQRKGIIRVSCVWVLIKLLCGIIADEMIERFSKILLINNILQRKTSTFLYIGIYNDYRPIIDISLRYNTERGTDLMIISCRFNRQFV